MTKANSRGDVNPFVAGSRFIALAILSLLVCCSAGCRRKEERVIVRILLPPGPSAVREEIVKLEVYPLKTGTGKIIVPARTVTEDEHDYREFLQKAQAFRPEQAVIVPTAEDIPALYQGQTRYPTVPCTALPRPCIALAAPWASAEERQALEIVLPRLAPDPKPK